jgi:mannose-6-phosphate isomerase-like protein (cupin superfamily)
MRRKLWTAIVLVAGYVVVSSLFHYALFPEPGPDPSDLPRNGTTIVNKGIGSRFVYRQTSIETAGQLFEWDNFVEPGGGPIKVPHVHPHLREIFRVIDGEVRFVINGEGRVVKAGEQIVVPPGAGHAFQNVSGKPVYMVSRFEAAGAERWDELAQKGLLIDSECVQFDRVGGIDRAGPIQMIVFGSRFKQGYMAGVPPWIQDAVSFLVAPTARLFGFHAYYPPTKPHS